MPRIEIHLTEEQAKKLGEMAKLEKRSRKNFCEAKLISIVEGQTVSVKPEINDLSELPPIKDISPSKREIVQSVVEDKVEEKPKANPEKEETVANFTLKRKTYDELLKMAKDGITDMKAFTFDLNIAKLTPGQKAMIISKIDQKIN